MPNFKSVFDLLIVFPTEQTIIKHLEEKRWSLLWKHSEQDRFNLVLSSIMSKDLKYCQKIN